MNASVRPTDAHIERVVREYGDVLFRICLVMLCQEQDAEDAVQETFLRYLTKAPAFHDDAHEKAWLITVAENICRNMLRFRLRHKTLPLDELSDYCREPEDIARLEFIMSLPDAYKSVLHLYYVEQYQTDEIAKILRLSPAAVRKRLQYGRKALAQSYNENQ